MALGNTFLGCLIPLLLLCISLSSAYPCPTGSDLAYCMIGTSDNECIIPDDTILSLTAPLAPNRDLTIRGGTNSVIDLESRPLHIQLVDLEVRNGQASGPVIARLLSVHKLFMTRVTFTNMYSSGSSASIQATTGQLSLSRVTFINVTSSNSAAASVIAGDEPVGWLLEDVSFINCTSDQAVPKILSVVSSSADSIVTFAGTISFNGSRSSPTNEALVFFSAGNGYSLYLNSDSTRPASWTFSEARQSAINFGTFSSPASKIWFEAISLQVISSQEYASRDSAAALMTFGSGTVNIFIRDWLDVFGLGVLLGYSATNLNVEGSITSDLCRSASVLDLGGACNITAKNIYISDPTYENIGLSSIQGSNITVENNLRIWRSLPPEPTLSRAIYARNAAHSIHVGGSLIVQGLYSTQSGAALSVDTGALSVKAEQIRFEGNTASQGGAVWVQSQLSMHATNITFQHNRAHTGHGGALFAGNNATLDLNGDIQFEGNTAERRGGALSIPFSQAHNFASASFRSNQANDSCAVFIMDICTAFVTSGTISSNIQLISTSSCPANDYMCLYRPVMPCLTPPPSAGSWVCVDGTWKSNGSVTGEVITIPATQVVVDGNFTVPGSVVFDGLGSSIVVLGGCVHIGGSIVVELTEEELEQLAKESRTVALISQNSSCPSLSSSSVDGRLSSKSCRKLESTTREENDGSRSSLVAVFKVNSSGCNVKWIILGSVLGGVLLLIIIIMLVVTFNDKARKAIRPFWARGHADL